MNGEFAVAVHALVYLNHRGGTVSSEVLAHNICTNPARVRKVMAILKRAGLITTREGPEGGYHFPLNPNEVTLRQVAEGTGTVFVSAAWKPGRDDIDCLVSSGMAGVMESLYSDLDRRCKDRLDEISISDLDKKLFQDRDGGTKCT